jgi:hypothetical protein
LTVTFLLASVIRAASNGIMNMDTQLDTIWKEIVVAYFKAQPQNFTGEAEEKCEYTQSILWHGR